MTLTERLALDRELALAKQAEKASRKGYKRTTYAKRYATK